MQLLTTRRDAPPPRDGAPGSDAGGNGGFPMPPAGEPVRVVRCRHAACGAETRIMLPAALPSEAVHRVVCDGCGRPFDPAADGSFGGASRRAPAFLSGVAAGLASARRRVTDGLPSLPRIPRSRLWAWASVPLAALGVVAGLSLIQGDDAAAPPPSTATPPAAAADGTPQARFFEGSGFSLAIPAGWKKDTPPKGAAFAAVSKDGLADATLWIEEDPDLTFSQFEKRSLEQLSEIGENARVTDRVEGPTVESTIVELRAEAPVADGVVTDLRVTLRGAGDYRYYFATSAQPGGKAGQAADIETFHASLRPDVSVAGLDEEVGE